MHRHVDSQAHIPSSPPCVFGSAPRKFQRAVMQIITIGFDIAKNVLRVHNIDAAEKVGGQETTSPQ
jgi:hypothetical protein